MNNWKIFTVTVQWCFSFFTEFHSFYTNMLLDLASSSFSFVGVTCAYQLQKEPTKDLELSKRCRWESENGCLVGIFGACPLIGRCICSFASIHGIYSLSPIRRIEWISGNDLCSIHFKSLLSANGPRLIGTLAILSLAYSSLPVYQPLILLFTIWALLLKYSKPLCTVPDIFQLQQI